MGRNIVVNPISRTPLEEQEIEIVERKGIGHPDSIADGLAESVSRALCRMYIEKYGRILHHNTDETQIVGGQSAPKFGGGMVLEPVYILLVGRAITEVDGERLPYRRVAMGAARDHLKKYCGHLNMDTDITLDCKIGRGSVDLTGVFSTEKLLANDTSFGVGFAPFTEVEKIVYETEKFINGPLKQVMPSVGEDVKVMGCRKGDKIDLTIAAAMVDSEINDKDHYISLINELHGHALDNAKKMTSREIDVQVNTADNYDDNIFYLTVTGLSMENGDDGSVGRGNRANGLITPYRPMSMEASAGKNPVTHVGKIYNLLSNKIAQDIVENAGGDIQEVYVRILSRIGKPIDEPQTAAVQMILAPGADASKVTQESEGIVDNWLDNITKITDMIINDEIDTF